MAEAVLDASAVLALIKREPGADLVERLLSVSIISTVNLAEAVTKLVDWDPLGPDRAWEEVQILDLNTVDFDLRLARRTGELRTATRKLGLSFADRACLALAEREDLPALTADRRWSELDSGVRIELIR